MHNTTVCLYLIFKLILLMRLFTELFNVSLSMLTSIFFLPYLLPLLYLRQQTNYTIEVLLHILNCLTFSIIIALST